MNQHGIGPIRRDQDRRYDIDRRQSGMSPGAIQAGSLLLPEADFDPKETLSHHPNLSAQDLVSAFFDIFR
jgi:hypothetical protein